MYAIQYLLSEFITRPVAYSGTQRIRSHFGGLELKGVEVDIIWDMQRRPPDGDWADLPDLPALIRWVEYSEMRLPVIDLEYEYLAYARMGRAVRAASIRHFLDHPNNRSED